MPVIFSYLSPGDTLLRVKVTLSSPIYDNASQSQYAAVKDANVVITSAQGNATFIFNNTTGYYELLSTSYPIFYGQTYKIVVTLADGSVAEGQTTIPAFVVPIKSLAIEVVSNNSGSYERAKISFVDDVSTANYYVLTTNALDLFFSSDTIVTTIGGKVLYNDVGNNGVLSQINYDLYGTIGGSYIAYDFYLINASKEYYDFYYSLQHYQEGNPFAEPTLVYSNIKGGHGVVAGFTSYKYRHFK